MFRIFKLLLILTVPILLGGCAIPKPQANTTVDSFPEEKIESLAQALTVAEVKVYGSQYCSACKIQGEMFGAAWSNINFVECSVDASETQNAACRVAEIKLYPTWEFSNGSRLEGMQSLETLAQKIGFVP